MTCLLALRWNPRSTLVLVMLTIVPTSLLVAQEGGRESVSTGAQIQSGSTPSTPAAPQNAAADAIEAAVQRAEQELADLLAELDTETRETGDEIVTATEAVFELRSREAAALAALEKLQLEIRSLDDKIVEAETEAKRFDDNQVALQSELRSQANDFRDRFRSGLLALETPDLLERATARLDATDGEAKGIDFGAEIDALLDLYLDVLDEARVASTFAHPLQLRASGDRIEEVRVLRVGLLGGYYAHPSSGDCGFILSGGDEGQSFRGESEGLTTLERSQIAGIVESPSSGGFLPFDVTGGAGIATLQSGITFARWFEMGGVFMWGLAVIAAIALVIVIERGIILSLRTLGMQRRIDRTLALVERRDLEAASEYCEGVGGITGEVLHAALVHAEEERSVMEDAVQEALLHNAPKFQTRLGFVSLCAAVSPLMGLLGTVTGMILTFKMITLFGTSDPRFMAGGISEALITTQGGLYVAIPCLIFRGILGSLAESGLGRLEAGAMSVVLAILKNREEEESPLEAGAVA